ncbi:MAG: hypothetical protein K9I69_08290, partial [Ignavibacteriales bacterium]|nr:hypothetical protein [Ignavibacteriales bacterium]
MSDLFDQSMEIYRKDTAERLADLTTFGLELLLHPHQEKIDTPQRLRIEETFDYILKQQKMLKDIDDICLIFQSEGQIHDLEDGDQIFNFVNEGIVPQNTDRYKRIEAKRYFRISYNDLFRNEMICSYKEGTHIFHVFTPYRIRG